MFFLDVGRSKVSASSVVTIVHNITSTTCQTLSSQVSDTGYLGRWIIRELMQLKDFVSLAGVPVY